MSYKKYIIIKKLPYKMSDISSQVVIVPSKIFEIFFIALYV